MHYGLPNAHITTLERNEDMFNEATKNFAKYSLNDKIDLIKGDALETLPNLIKENKTYDFIFIDAAKGQRSEEHTSELQSRGQLVCRLLLEKKTNKLQPGWREHRRGSP